MQIFFKRKAFIEFLRAVTQASEDQFAEEATTKIWPCMMSITEFLARFTKPISPAAVGAMSLDAVVDDVAGDSQGTEEEKAGVPAGLANAAYKAFEDFIEPLSPTGKLFATVLYKIHTCGFDQELSAIVMAETNQARTQFPWADLLSSISMQSETRIHGIPVPLLAQACSKWIQSKHEAAAKSSESSAVGDEDRTMSRAVQGLGDNQDEEEQKRLKTIAQLSELLQEDQIIVAYPAAEKNAVNLTRALTNLDSIIADTVEKRNATPLPLRRRPLHRHL